MGLPCLQGPLNSLKRSQTGHAYHWQANDGLRKLPLDKYTAVSGVGLPYPVAELGPPRPRCHDARVATLRAMNILDTPPQPNIGAGTMNM